MNAWSGKIPLINLLLFTAGENTTNILFAGLVFFSFTSFSGHRPAQKEWARTGLIAPMPNSTTRKGWPNHRGLRPLHFLNSGVGSFYKLGMQQFSSVKSSHEIST